MNTPRINVTPLIDVLLVLLIIFMVISPLKPMAFKTRVPGETTNQPQIEPHPDTLAIEVGMDAGIKLNTQPIATTTETEPLVTRLKQIFDARIANGSISETFGNDADHPMGDRIERTVFIKAPKSLSYGNVARVVDAAKLAGAYPISLQIYRLDQ